MTERGREETKSESERKIETGGDYERHNHYARKEISREEGTIHTHTQKRAE